MKRERWTFGERVVWCMPVGVCAAVAYEVGRGWGIAAVIVANFIGWFEGGAR